MKCYEPPKTLIYEVILLLCHVRNLTHIASVFNG